MVAVALDLEGLRFDPAAALRALRPDAGPCMTKTQTKFKRLLFFCDWKDCENVVKTYGKRARCGYCGTEYVVYRPNEKR